jgi:FkbM family methyltransferase
MSDAAVIYDFGMNNGDDVEYYLLKADRVVAVEANSASCDEACQRFSSAIADGRLTILNVALSNQETSEPVTFYLHKQHHVLSQLPRPDEARLQEFDPVEVPSRTPASIIRDYGDPLYVKIDVEHFDLPVLQNIFAAGIFPSEISAEAHDVGVFASLVANGYTSFNLVDGGSVHRTYVDTRIATRDGPKPFSFKEHSAGPFGEDLRTPWEDPNSFFYTLANAGLGWKDVHATKLLPPRQPQSNAALFKREATAFMHRLVQAVRSGALKAPRVS